MDINELNQIIANPLTTKDQKAEAREALLAMSGPSEQTRIDNALESLLTTQPDDAPNPALYEPAIQALYLDLVSGLLGFFKGPDFKATLERLIDLHDRTSNATVRRYALQTIETTARHGGHYRHMPAEVQQAANDFLNSLVTK